MQPWRLGDPPLPPPPGHRCSWKNTSFGMMCLNGKVSGGVIASTIRNQGRWPECDKLTTGLLQERAGRERAVLLSNRCAALVALGVLGGEAVADARGAVLAAPSFVKGHLRLGTALLDRGDWADAIDALKEGLTLDPMHAQLRGQLERAVRLSQS